MKSCPLSFGSYSPGPFPPSSATLAAGRSQDSQVDGKGTKLWGTESLLALDSDSQPVLKALQLLLALIWDQLCHPAVRWLFLTQLPGHSQATALHSQSEERRKTVHFRKPQPPRPKAPSHQLPIHSSEKTSGPTTLSTGSRPLSYLPTPR